MGMWTISGQSQSVFKSPIEMDHIDIPWSRFIAGCKHCAAKIL